MTCPDDGDTNWTTVMGRLRIELRILTDLLNRLEYTISDHLMAQPNARISADLQILDLIIQSTHSLEGLTGSLEVQSETGGAPDLISAANQIGLKDMVNRLAHGLERHKSQETSSISGHVDLF